MDAVGEEFWYDEGGHLGWNPAQSQGRRAG